jgi:hypothetical protein
MFTRSRNQLVCLAVLLVLGWEAVPPPLDSGEIAKSKSASDLRAFLEGQGYVGVPFLPWNSGYFVIEARVNGKQAFLIVDTGAPHSCLDPGRTKDFGVKWLGSKNLAFGGIDSLEVGPIRTGRRDIFDFDLTPSNKVLASNGNPEAHGLLGSDFLGHYRAIIDYPNRKLYLQPKAEEATVAVKASPAPAPHRCTVGFWNLTGRDGTLIVEGTARTLAKNRSVRIDLTRQFEWHIEGGPKNSVRVPESESEHEVVIR